MTDAALLHMSEGDLRFVVETVATQRSDHAHVATLVRDKPDILDRMLDDDQLFRRLTSDDEALVRVSPWLLFTVLLRRAARDLPRRRFTVEHLGGGEQVPVFDAERVGALLRDRPTRDYLAELLASFVRTDSAVFYYRSGRRYRRRSYSDIDIDDMIALAGNVAEEHRFPFYRRIGDICLFITGVFPEQVRGTASLVGGQTSRDYGRGRRNLTEYQEHAARFYGLAASHPVAERLGLSPVLARLGEDFALARKPLAFIADNYLHLRRQALFGTP